MTDKTHPEAGSTHIIRYALELGLLWIDGDGRNKVREALAALDALEAQLEAVGAAPGEQLTREQIREVFMTHGFTIKEGQTDLKQYVYDAAYALLELVAAPPAEQQAATKAAPGEPVAWRISCPNEPDLGFWLAEEDGGEGFLSEPLYTRTAPQAAGQDARPCHVFTVRKAGGLTEWEPTTMALALPDGAHALYTLPQPSPHAQADSVTAPAVASEPIAYLYDDGSWTPAKTEEGHKLNNWMISAGSPKIGVHLASTAQPTPLTTLAQATQAGNQQEAQEPVAHDEDLLEQLYWDFDSQRKKTDEERLAFKGKMRSYASEFRRRSVGQMVFAQSVSDDMMNLADRLGDLPYVDPRAWRHLLVYAPQQEAQEPATVPYQKLTNEIDLILSDTDTELSIGAKRALLWMRTWVSVPLYAAPQPAPLSDDVVKDAARYRWLRDTSNADDPSHMIALHIRDEQNDASLSGIDAAIDAALAAQGGKT